MLTVGAVKKHPDADGLYVEVSEEFARRVWSSDPLHSKLTSVRRTARELSFPAWSTTFLSNRCVTSILLES